MGQFAGNVKSHFLGKVKKIIDLSYAEFAHRVVNVKSLNCKN